MWQYQGFMWTRMFQGRPITEDDLFYRSRRNWKLFEDVRLWTSVSRRIWTDVRIHTMVSDIWDIEVTNQYMHHILYFVLSD